MAKILSRKSFEAVKMRTNALNSGLRGLSLCLVMRNVPDLGDSGLQLTLK